MPKELYKIINIPTIIDEARLSFAETAKHIPFPIRRFYLIYNANNGAIRGMHAHKQLEQVLFCVKGKLEIVIDNGERRETVLLDSPEKGLYLSNLVWREMHNFDPDTILFVVASQHYDESDYIRDYQTFLQVSQAVRSKPKTLREWLKFVTQEVSMIADRFFSRGRSLA